MTDPGIEKHVREYYEGQELAPATLERLKKTIAPGDAASRRLTVRSRWTAIAAAALIALLSGILISMPHRPEHVVARQIAAEAARDHNLRLAVEVPARTYIDVRGRMNNLEFTPVEPESLKQMPMQLLGARYASLQGQPAVQLKLADPRGEICWLIQARPIERLAKVKRLSRHEIDGLIVDVWREKGLVMVLTRPIA